MGALRSSPKDTGTEAWCEAPRPLQSTHGLSLSLLSDKVLYQISELTLVSLALHAHRARCPALQVTITLAQQLFIPAKLKGNLILEERMVEKSKVTGSQVLQETNFLL